MSFTKVESASSPDYLAGDATDNKTILPRFEINCDMGEGYGPWKLGPDAELMPLIDAANVACGGHAGDPKIMKETVQLAKKYGVRVGSHPGLPDKIGFGRRPWNIDPEDVYNLVVYQTGALKAFLDAEGMPLSHIKPHGELYFYVEKDEGVMRAVLRAAKVFNVPVVAAKSSRYMKVVKEYNMQLIQEVYPDLNYNPTGDLCRIKAGPNTVRTPDKIYDCVMRAGFADQLVDVNDNVINLHYDGSPISFCLHSDMPTALENATRAREAITKVNQAMGYSIK